MLVRIQWKRPARGGLTDRERFIALALGTLLAPAALVAFTMAFWRIAADLRLTSSFVISSGVFSHWQVWLVSAALLLLSVSLLNRSAGAAMKLYKGEQSATDKK
jgi:hypothetical protein